MNFAAEGLLAQIPAQEDRLDRAAQLTQRLVGRVHHLGAAKPAQDRLRVGGFVCIAAAYLTISSYCCSISSQLIGLARIGCKWGSRVRMPTSGRDRKSTRLQSSH